MRETLAAGGHNHIERTQNRPGGTLVKQRVQRLTDNFRLQVRKAAFCSRGLLRWRSRSLNVETAFSGCIVCEYSGD